MKKIKVVVCGLGYAGLSFLRNIYDEKYIEIIAIDQNPYHYLQPEVYGYIANEKLLSEIIIDLFALTYGISNVQFILDKVKNIDFQNKIVFTENFSINYDIIVLSLGSRTFFPPIKGLRDFSSGVKTIDKSMKFKHFFEKTILKKIKNENLCFLDRKGKFNIVIGGGGLSGVEIAAEMAVFQERLFSKIGCGMQKPDIYIIEAFPSILYGMDDFLIETAYKRLKELGVNIITGKKIVEVEEKKVILDDSSELYSDFLIWTGGIVGSSVLNNMDIEKNRKNQVIVDHFFRIKGYEDAFAIGDCAEIRNFETGDILPATAQIAIQSGAIVAKHIKNILSKKKLEKIYPVNKGVIAALGGNYAAGVLYNKLKIKGYIAYILKSSVFEYYKFTLRKQIKKTRNLLSQDFHL